MSSRLWFTLVQACVQAKRWRNTTSDENSVVNAIWGYLMKSDSRSWSRPTNDLTVRYRLKRS